MNKYSIYWLVFISWLKYHNLYKSFLFNRKKTSSMWKDYKLYDKEPEDYIDYSFEWASTKEGDDFWSEKHDKWLSFIERFKEDYENGNLKHIKNYGRMFIRNY